MRKIIVCIALMLTLTACAKQDGPTFSLIPTGTFGPEQAEAKGLLSLVAHAEELAHEEEDEGLEPAPEGLMALGHRQNFTAELKAWHQEIAAEAGVQITGYGDECRKGSTVSRSYHPRCMALDAHISGDVAKYVEVARRKAKSRGYGGVGRYGSRGLVHLDVGPYCFWNGFKAGTNKRATNTIECDPKRSARRAAAAQRKQEGKPRRRKGQQTAEVVWPWN